MPPPVALEERERQLVRATRELFDKRGMQDAPVEEIARSVGIARGLIYRQFSSKEELYVLTVTDYLTELSAAMEAALDAADGAGHRDRLAGLVTAYARFCLRYPAFLDCSLRIMQRPAKRLNESVSDSVWLRLGAGMASCIGPLCDVLRDGRATGEFTCEDPDFTANALWTQGLGLMHLSRIKVGLRRGGAGPELFVVDDGDVVATCVRTALTAAGVS